MIYLIKLIHTHDLLDRSNKHGFTDRANTHDLPNKANTHDLPDRPNIHDLSHRANTHDLTNRTIYMIYLEYKCVFMYFLVRQQACAIDFFPFKTDM